MSGEQPPHVCPPQQKQGFYERAREIFNESGGTCSERYILRCLSSERYAIPTPSEMRFYMAQWLASDTGVDGLAYTLNGSQKQVATGARVLKHIDRYIDDGNLQGVQQAFESHIDLSVQIIDKIMSALPHIEVKEVAEVRALANMAQQAAHTATELRSYMVNMQADQARPVDQGDDDALEGEILPPVRNAVDLSEAMERFKKRA
jgi:hypothetical protein